MQKKKIIIDCDPGYDDAVAILLAAGNPLIDVLAITTVAGNQTLEKVTRNALRIAKLAHLDHVPIAAGAARPLLRDQIVVAANIHGESGLERPCPKRTIALIPVTLPSSLSTPSWPNRKKALLWYRSDR